MSHLSHPNTVKVLLYGELDDGSLYDRIIGEVEKPLIEAMLARHGGNQLRAARAIGLNRNTLRKRLDVLGIDPLARPVTANEE